MSSTDFTARDDGQGPNVWLRRAVGDVEPAARLVCFPHAGGGASSFNPWRAALPSWIELIKVQLPGREDRRSLVPHTEVHTLVDELLPHLASVADLPLVLYGHSMGALIAFEVSRRLRAVGYPLPRALLISSRRAPDRPLREQHVLHTLPETEFAERVDLLGGLPVGLLASQKWRSLYLPTIRADLHLSDVYEYREEPPLACPLHTFIGEADNLVVREDWEAWSEHSSRDFTRRVLPGGHFFSKAGWQSLIAEVGAITRQVTAPVEREHGKSAEPAIENRSLG